MYLFSKILFLSLGISSMTYGQSLDLVIDKSLNDFYYGQSYCNYIDSLITIAQVRNLENEKAELYGLKALCFSNTSERDSIELLLSIVRKGPSDRAMGLTNFIDASLLLGEEKDELAIQSYVRALELYNPIRDQELIILTQLAIGWAYYGIFSYDNAIKYANPGLLNAKKKANPYNVIEGLDILANSYLRIEDSEKADSFFSEYLAVAKTIDNPRVSYWANSSAGHSFVSAGVYDSAHHYYQSSYEASIALQDSFLQIEALLYLGENAQRIQDVESAIKHLTKVQSFPGQYHRSALDRRVNEYLAEAYSDQGDYVKAFQYLSQYKEIDDKYWNEESRNIALGFEAKYQSLQKDAEIATQKLQISRSQAQRNLLLVGALGLGLLTWFLFYRTKKNQKLATSKIENLEKQQKLMALDYMVQGQEEERKRIAQDLHDGLGGLLTSVRHQIRSIQDQIASLSKVNIVGDAEKLIGKACDEVRRISHDMMPASLVSLGLVDAIEDLVTDLQENNDLDVQFTTEGNFEMISDKVKVNIYRIIQEATNNTIKHAEASEIKIRLFKSEGELKLEISDDGKGFDYKNAKEKDGIGLKSIASRVKYLEGELKMESDENGTKYSISITV